jgi:hypothetical protein
MITERTGRKIDKVFDELKPKLKNRVFQEVKDLGLKIEFGAESWEAYMRRKARMTQGKLSKMYELFAEFEKDDVDVFLNAFSEVNEPLEVPVKRVVYAIDNAHYSLKQLSDLELQLMLAKNVQDAIEKQLKQTLRG